jgi:hypothetical protein
MAEREVRVGVPADVEPVGILERLGIPVRGGAGQQDGIAGPDGDPVDVDVCLGVARDAHPCRCGDPQDLLHCPWHDIGVAPEEVALVGMGHEQQGADVDARHRRLVPREQQRRPDERNRVLAKAAVLGGEQVRQHVLPRSSALAVDQLGHVAHQCPGRRRGGGSVGEARRSLRPHPELLRLRVTRS